MFELEMWNSSGSSRVHTGDIDPRWHIMDRRCI